MQLRDYQETAIRETLAAIDSDLKPVLQVATGGGKSLIGAELLREIAERNQRRLAGVMSITHTRELIRQNSDAFARWQTAIPSAIYSAGLGEKRLDAPVVFAGVQSLVNAEYAPPSALLVDEAHRVPPSFDGQYGEILSRAPDAVHVGLTATPYRLDSGRLDEGEGAMFNIILQPPGCSAAALQQAGYLSPLTGVASRDGVDATGVHVRAGDFVRSELEQIATTPECIARVVRAIIQHAEGRRAILVFAVSVEHARLLSDALSSAGCPAAMLSGETPIAERDALLSAFAAGKLRALVNCAVLTTGYDYPGIDCIAIVRPTMSKGLFCLDYETEILTSHGWKRHGEINVGDIVPAMDLKTGKGVWSSVHGVVDRSMRTNESWVSINSPRANFRVTNKHSMIIKSRDDHKKGMPWRKISADEIDFQEAILPAAVEIDQPGVPLNDHELYFLGIVMTDGSVSSTTVQICQSERHPEILTRIESALDGAGLAWVKAKRKCSSSPTSIIERHHRFIYTIPIGRTRNTQGKWRFKNSLINRDGIGCGHLLPFLDKDFSTALMALNKRQFEILLKAIHDGDGFKTQKCPSVNWTVRSWMICSARIQFIERMQALCAIHGYTGHLRREARGDSAIWILTATPQSWRSIITRPRNDGRPAMVYQPATQENVWCIETEHGTIITRRKGKVTVMGNCQMIGRGLRKAAGKTDCLILDFGGNWQRHGRDIDGLPGTAVQDEIQEDEERAAKKQRKKRQDEQQQADQQRRRIFDLDQGQEGNIAPVETRVLRVSWKLQDSKSIPGTQQIMVTYQTTEGQVNVWLLPEHPKPFPRMQSRPWFSRRGLVMPQRAVAALPLIRSAQRPETISIRRDGNFWRVICEHFATAEGPSWE